MFGVCFIQVNHVPIVLLSSLDILSDSLKDQKYPAKDSDKGPKRKIAI